MKYLSICSGIEAATTAWHDLGWTPFAFSEIEAFPCEVLKHHWPHVPNLGDMTKYDQWDSLHEVNLLVGGTPCQAFSVAGLRNSLDDARGNLTLTYVQILNKIDYERKSRNLSPAICLWENVPGVLNTKDNAFGCFLGALAGEDTPLEPAGGRWTNAGYVRGPERTIAWRIVDAQYFGVAQRRRRVFVVASARDGFCPEQILFESEGVRRDSPPSREKGEGIASGVGDGIANGSGGDGSASCYDYLGTQGGGVEEGISPTLKKKDGVATVVSVGFNGDQSEQTHSMGERVELAPTLRRDGPVHAAVAYGLDEEQNGKEEIMGTLKARTHSGGPQHAVAFAQNTRDEVWEMAVVGALAAEPGMKQTSYIRQQMVVRRLTPIECARLQGFPDHHARIPWRGKPAEECPDGPQYKAYGNSMAVPCMRWLGERIDQYLFGGYEI